MLKKEYKWYRCDNFIEQFIFKIKSLIDGIISKLIFFTIFKTLPNGHMFVDSPSIRRRSSTWKVRGNYIDFERGIHALILTSVRRGYFDVDSTFEIDEISMSSPRGFFYVVSASNRCNFCTHCFHSIIF